MKRILKILVFIILIFYTNVYAVDKCTTEEMKRLKELANNVEFKTEYEFDLDSVEEGLENVDIIYSINILNFHDDIKIFYKTDFNDNMIEVPYKQAKLNNFIESENITFYIYSYTNNLCTDEIIKTVKLELPVYNDYYYFHKEKCDLKPDFKYCKEFLNVGEHDFEEIDKLYEEYAKEEIYDDIKENIFENWYFYIGGSVFLLAFVLVIVIIKEKNKKKKDDI